MSFVVENEIYDLLAQVEIKPPRYHTVKNEKDIELSPFAPGAELVIKGIALDLWHKSDLGLVQFKSFEKNNIIKICDEMQRSLVNQNQYKWQHTLLIEKVNFKKNSQLPTEVFVSLKKDISSGWILLWGIGGVQSEFWAGQIPPISINLQTTSIEKACEKISDHFTSQILLGKVRGSQPLIDEKVLFDFIKNIFKLPALLDQKGLELLEINPFVINQEGQFTPLDGVGVKFLSSEKTEFGQTQNTLQKLFMPKKIGIVGVSSRAESPTNIILENALKSDCEVSVIKDSAELLEKPVDLLVVGINSQNTFKLINQLLDQNGGAEYLYLVTGGISDGSDHEHLGEKILKLLSERRRQNKWTPKIIGPNGLGLISAPVKLNTLFIPNDKLAVDYASESKSNLAIISQSGAFMITRLSQMPTLQPKYAISIGGKMDLKISDLIEMFEQDPQVSTIGLYVEGFDQNEALQTAQKIKKSSKKFVIYKGGRSALGAQAALSHTGAMMTDYGLLQTTFDLPNVWLTDTFSEWNAKLLWLKKYPQFEKNSSWGFITNAGYESVGSGDFAKDAHLALNSEQLSALKAIIEKHHLQSLVSASNPLDLTPMASEQVWLDCAELFLQTSMQNLLLGIVPLTQRLNTSDNEKYNSFIKALAALAEKYQKNIGVILDVGEHYYNYRSAFVSHDIPVFNSIEQALKALL